MFADLIDGPLAHIPSGRFGANSTWVLCAAIAHNLLRAAGALAGGNLTKARGATPATQTRRRPGPPGPTATKTRAAPARPLALDPALATTLAGRPPPDQPASYPYHQDRQWKAGQTSGYTTPETKWWARRRRTHHTPTGVGGFRLR